MDKDKRKRNEIKGLVIGAIVGFIGGGLAYLTLAAVLDSGIETNSIDWFFPIFCLAGLVIGIFIGWARQM